MSLVRNFVMLAFVGLASSTSITYSADSVTQDTELVFAFLVHRHGDRTPVDGSTAFLGLDDYTEVDALIEPWGYGQLTNAGKRTGFKTGQFIRQRYNDLIADKFNRSEIYIRSTDSTRTKMTVLSAMSAVYPTGDDNWSQDIDWDPVPYTTLPVKYDFNEAGLNCPVLTEASSVLMLAPNSRMDPYADLIQKVSDIIGIDITSTPVLISSVYDVYVSVNSLGYDIPDDIKELMPEIEEAAGVAWDITQGDERYLNYQAGPLLNEFFTYADQVIAGSDTQKLRVYSAHDANVYSFESIIRADPRQGAPKYGSLMSLELRRVEATGQYVVQPVYLADPHEGTETILSVKGCSDDELCPYDEFYTLTADDLRTEDQWRSDCGFSNDLQIDSSSVD